MRSGNKLTSGPWLKAEPLWLAGRGEPQQNSVDSALQGLSQEITLFFPMSSRSWSEIWMNAQHDPEKSCNLSPCRGRSCCVSKRTCVFRQMTSLCALRLGDKEASKKKLGNKGVECRESGDSEGVERSAELSGVYTCNVFGNNCVLITKCRNQGVFIFVLSA